MENDKLTQLAKVRDRPDREKIAKRIIKRIDEDISDRRGLKWEWSKIDKEVMNNELKPTWKNIIIQELALFDEEGIRKQIRAELNAEIRIELGSKAFEQGKKYERERLIDYIKEKSDVDTPEYIDKNGKHWMGGYLVISLKNWQALKEGEKC